MSTHRRERVASRIQAELATLLLTGVKDPRLMSVSITEVKITADLQQARVFYTVFDEDADLEAIEQGLDRAAGFLRTEIGKRVQLRRTPSISFSYDKSLEKGNRMDALLAGLREAGEMGEE